MKYETMKETALDIVKVATGALFIIGLASCGPSQYETMQKQQEDQRKMYQTERARSHANEDHKDLDSQFE
jgi:hypothetical protein